jgi:tetrahydromethanopterin S-methyltransferase subunit G
VCKYFAENSNKVRLNKFYKILYNLVVGMFLVKIKNSLRIY